MAQYEKALIDESFEKYKNIQLNGGNNGTDDNVCFYIQRGSIDYPFNQEDYLPFGSKYNEDGSQDPISDLNPPIYTKSVNRIVNGLYDTSKQMYTISKEEAGTQMTDVLYIGAPKDLSEQQESGIANLIAVNNININIPSADNIIPFTLMEIVQFVKNNEFDFVTIPGNGVSGGLINERKSGDAFLANIDGTSINDEMIENVIDESFELQPQAEFSIKEIEYKNSLNPNVMNSSVYGRVVSVTIVMSLLSNTSTFKVYFDPDVFFSERLGSADKIDVWYFRDEPDDKYNINYGSVLYDKIVQAIEEGSPDDRFLPKTIVNIESDDISKYILDAYRSVPDYSRHTSYLSYTLRRRVFLDSAGGIKKLGEDEDDNQSLMTFYVFYSSEDKPSSAIMKQKILSDLKSFILDKLKTEPNFKNLIGEGFDKSDNEALATEVVKYVYPELDITFEVFIRKMMNLTSESYRNTDHYIRFNANILSNACGRNDSSSPPFYSSNRGVNYYILTPCYVKDQPDVNYNDKLMKYSQIAYVINSDGSDIDSSLTEFVMGYTPGIINLVETSATDPNWDIGASDSVKFRKLVTFAAICYSKANSSIFNDESTIYQALLNDTDIGFSKEKSDSGIKQIIFTLRGIKYHIVSPDTEGV